MKASDLSVNERNFFHKMFDATELVVGGYENIIQDGGTTEAPTVEQIIAEAYGEVGIQINNAHEKNLHFIGKDRMNELAAVAAKRSLRGSMFA